MTSLAENVRHLEFVTVGTVSRVMIFRSKFQAGRLTRFKRAAAVAIGLAES
jgi:hypothetical protein